MGRAVLAPLYDWLHGLARYAIDAQDALFADLGDGVQRECAVGERVADRFFVNRHRGYVVRFEEG